MRLNETMQNIEREIHHIREEKKSKERSKELRKNAKKQPLRDSISEEEFYFILELIKHKNFVPSRKITAYILLFVTGLRVSNLLILTVSHLKQLLNQGSTQISLIKKGPQRFALTLSSKGKELIKQYHKEFFLLMRDKEDNQFFFTTQVFFDKPIHRASFDNEINAVLI